MGMVIKNHLKFINQVLDYIELNIHNKISLIDLAEETHFSMYHLHRLMRTTVGLPLIEYIRARKLSHSTMRLMNDKLPIIDISLEYHYEHEQTYIRAFRKQFGITPSKFRNSSHELQLIEKFDTAHLTEIEDGIIFHPVFKAKPSFLLAGIQHSIDIETNQHHHIANNVGNSFFYEHQERIANRLNDRIYFGLTRFANSNTYTLYMPSIEISSIKGVSPEYDVATIPANTYIVFRYIGTFHPRQLTLTHLNHIWDYIDNWLPKSRYYHSAPYFFEYINENIASEGYCEVDLYIPIKQKINLHLRSSFMMGMEVHL